MSDSVDWVVDLDASLDEAEALASKVRSWLVDQDVVSKAVCAHKCYVGSDLLLPGPRASSPDWAAFGWTPTPGSMEGYSVVIGRRVFHTGGNGLQGLHCPHCGHQHDPDALPWADAVQAWFVQDGSDSMHCSVCSSSSSVVDWRFAEFEWAFGNLGFAFWNWPVSEKLVQHIGALLGHRVRLVHEHI
jgi:hypothetical protein